jgi:hypothetical protein
LFDVTWARLSVGEVLNVFGEGCDHLHTCLNLSNILLLMYPLLRWRCFLAQPHAELQPTTDNVGIIIPIIALLRNMTRPDMEHVLVWHA